MPAGICPLSVSTPLSGNTSGCAGSSHAPGAGTARNQAPDNHQIRPPARCSWPSARRQIGRASPVASRKSTQPDQWSLSGSRVRGSSQWLSALRWRAAESFSKGARSSDGRPSQSKSLGVFAWLKSICARSSSNPCASLRCAALRAMVTSACGHRAVNAGNT
ncbi:hypothetical protein D3C76_1237680 [compost metagenome]